MNKSAFDAMNNIAIKKHSKKKLNENNKLASQQNTIAPNSSCQKDIRHMLFVCFSLREKIWAAQKRMSASPSEGGIAWKNSRKKMSNPGEFY